MPENEIHQDLREDIKQLYSHAEIANKEMSIIKTDIASLKESVDWLKWAVRWMLVGIGGTVFVTLINIVLNLIKK